MATHYVDVPVTQARVQAAIDGATSGDTVECAADTQTWTTGINIPATKAITLQGAGIGNTVITASSAGTRFTGNDAFRMTGFEWIDGFWWIQGQDWRVDHCKLRYTGSTSNRTGVQCISRGTSIIYPAPRGVIDNCEIARCRIVAYGSWIGGGSDIGAQHALWAATTPIGTQDAVFVEDCILTSDNLVCAAVDGNCGGSYVMRHCELTNRYMEAHSVQGDHRAVRSWEVYDNTFYRDMSSWFLPARPRGGTGVFFNNTIAGTWPSYTFMLDNVRSYESRGTYAGIADGTSLWDGNTVPIETYRGWLVRDQPGTGSDVALSAGETGADFEPQAHDPAYCWDNYRDTSDPVVFSVSTSGYCQTHIVENRDFYNNTQRPGYVSYTYPHPLRGETPAPVVPVMRQNVRLRFG